MAPHAHENLDERLLHRMLFFTDAVFAIVLTLLVLELRPPPAETGELFYVLAPQIGVFAFSFLILGLFWVAHLNTTRRLARFDWPTALANLLFLLPICLIPFASAWFGENPSGDPAWTFYCGIMIATSLANILVVAVSYRSGGRLIAGGAQRREWLYRVVRASAPGVAFAAGLGLMAAGESLLARYCWVLIGPIFGLAEWLLRPKTVA